jgi:hypothetical protein
MAENRLPKPRSVAHKQRRNQDIRPHDARFPVKLSPPIRRRHHESVCPNSRTSENSVKAKFAEHPSVLKNSTMLIWRPDQELRDPFPAVFWPWFSGVGFVFDLPTGQIATFSTR